MKKRILAVAFCLSISLALIAQSNLKDPGIPDGETIRYRTFKGKDGLDIEYSSQSVFLITEEDTEYYRIKSNSIKQLDETLVTVGSFIPVRVEKHIYGKRNETRNLIELITIPQILDNEIPILDMTDMAHILRGYPFEAPKDMKLLFLGQGSDGMGDMAIWIKFVAEESITLNNNAYRTYKLELKPELSGAMKIFSGLIPKTFLWFNKDDAHHLLRMEGSEGPGADNTIIVEMISYTK